MLSYFLSAGERDVSSGFTDRQLKSDSLHCDLHIDLFQNRSEINNLLLQSLQQEGNSLMKHQEDLKSSAAQTNQETESSPSEP